MRILLVFEPGVDGVFRHVEALTQFLLGRGQRVALAYSSKRGSKALESLVTSTRERGEPTIDMKVGNRPCLGDALALAAVARLVNSWKPDVIHAHSSKAGVLGRAIARLAGVPACYTPNAYYGMGNAQDPITFAFNSIERFFAPLATTINISADEATFAREVLGVARAQQIVAHNPTNPAVFTPATDEERVLARRKLGIPEDALALGSIGRLTQQKDPVTLYRAFAEAACRHPSLILVHIGEGGMDHKLQRLAGDLGISDRIKRVAYQDDPCRFYWAIDALVMSSTYEAGWPIVILEAMSCGLPVAATTAPGMSDIGFAGLSHCWTAPVGDYVALGGAIESLLKDMPKKRRSNHRETIVDRFTPEVCFGKVLDLYRQIASSKRKQHDLAFSG